ncbi:MAG: YlbF family regulator [Deltaproteobacteria bacterium]|nr:YlbF family regulator [Deltaproteobacteria bacterium]
MDRLNRNTVSIFEVDGVKLARELALSIGETPQHRRFEDTMNKIHNDPDAKRLLTEFQEKLQAFQMMQSWGGVSEEDFDHIEQLQEQLFMSPTLKEYFQAQNDLVQMLKELNIFISERIGFDFAGFARPADGCC